ncbi:uncharacterized protein [Dysidea avara]|uniref:uncharacterized protein n=1 Tax=Dysidea avara TaxID=196820 RepID=UPI003323E53D
MDGRDVIERRGCLYLCKSTTKKSPKATSNSCVPGPSTGSHDDDLPPPTFLWKRLRCFEKGTTATTTADGEDLTSFRRLREEQDKEFADALAIDEAKEIEKTKEEEAVTTQHNNVEALREQLSKQFTVDGIPANQPGITIGFRLPKGLNIFYRFGMQSHTKDLYEYAFAMGDMVQPFLLVTVIPRKEVPITGLLSDAGLTDSTILYVEVNEEHGFNLTKINAENENNMDENHMNENNMNENRMEPIVISSESDEEEDLEHQRMLLDETAKVNVDLCRICTVDKRDCVILPCGHAGICTTCAKKVEESKKKCPFCREDITSIQRIYF